MAAGTRGAIFKSVPVDEDVAGVDLYRSLKAWSRQRRRLGPPEARAVRQGDGHQHDRDCRESPHSCLLMFRYRCVCLMSAWFRAQVRDLPAPHLSVGSPGRCRSPAVLDPSARMAHPRPAQANPHSGQWSSSSCPISERVLHTEPRDTWRYDRRRVAERRSRGEGCRNWSACVEQVKNVDIELDTMVAR